MKLVCPRPTSARARYRDKASDRCGFGQDGVSRRLRLSLDDEGASPFSDDSGLRSGDLDHRGRSDEMVHFAGLDVSVQETSVCVVDDAGKVILEQKVATEPADIIALLASLGVRFGRIGIEAGPLSQWLVNALTAAELPVICVETRHMKALLTAQQINKTDHTMRAGSRR
jgi:hypothetical protein